jgi:hypothetical protein
VAEPSKAAVLNIFLFRVPPECNFSSIFYSQSCWCIIEVMQPIAYTENELNELNKLRPK